MGYTTDFSGEFKVSPPLKPEHQKYLRVFSETRRMSRNPALAVDLPDPVREAAGLDIGVEGQYFVGGIGYAGQDEDPSITNYNEPPAAQPGLWCQWEPNEEGTAIRWDGGEKFYEYVKWLQYLLDHFLIPWGYTLDGEVEWQGEDRDDRGKIIVQANQVSIKLYS